MEKMSDYDILVLCEDKDKMRKIAKASILILNGIGKNTDYRKTGELFESYMNRIIKFGI